MKTREDSRVIETTKRPFSHGDAETGKAASTGDADKWRLELVSVVCFSVCTSVSSHHLCPWHLSHFRRPLFPSVLFSSLSVVSLSAWVFIHLCIPPVLVCFIYCTKLHGQNDLGEKGLISYSTSTQRSQERSLREKPWWNTTLSCSS